MYLKTIDLKENDRFIFDLIRPDKFPALRSLRMYYKTVGTERVHVSAGIFNCKKILFSCKNFILGKLYRSYFYVTDDENRYFVKEENPTRGFVVELEKIENNVMISRPLSDAHR
jgi:hypothetical protein